MTDEKGHLIFIVGWVWMQMMFLMNLVNVFLVHHQSSFDFDPVKDVLKSFDDISECPFGLSW